MKSKSIKILSVITISTILLTSFASCGKNEKKDNPSPTPVEASKQQESKEPAQLKLFLIDQKEISGNEPIIRYIEEKTNTKLEITATPDKEVENKLNILLASGTLPDVIQFKSDEMQAKLIKGKVLLPISDSFSKYPDLKKTRNDDYWKINKAEDGKNYVIGSGEPSTMSILAYRKDWLDKFNLPVPKTMDEYYKVADAMSNQDPDGNGKKDTFAFGGQGAIDKWFDHIWGAYGALPNYFTLKDGHIVSGSIQPEIKDAVKMLRKMYQNKMIDPEFVTDDQPRWKTKLKAGIYGAGQIKVHIFDKNNYSNYYQPFKSKNPNGDFVYGPVLQGASKNPIGMRSDNASVGYFRTAIAQKSKNVDGALRLVTWLASEEGNTVNNYGLKDEHYSVDSTGFVKMLKNDADMTKWGTGKLSIGNTPLFKHASPEFIDAVAFTNKASTKNVADGIVTDEFISTNLTLEDFTNSSLMAMIVEQKDIDKAFDDFVKEWTKRGGDKVTKSLDDKYQKTKK